MIPFLYFDLRSIVKQFLEIIVESGVIDNCRSGRQYIGIDLTKKQNLLPSAKLNQAITNLKRKDVVTNKEIQNFKDGAWTFLIEMLSKLFERSFLGSVFLKSASIFDPEIINEQSKEKLQEQWKSLLKC